MLEGRAEKPIYRSTQAILVVVVSRGLLLAQMSAFGMCPLPQSVAAIIREKKNKIVSRYDFYAVRKTLLAQILVG